VNDSKATNVASALAGIESFEQGVHVILGGSLKGERFERLSDALVERASAAYLIGDAAPQLADDLAAAARSGVTMLECRTLERAVESAAERAQPGDVVLLSPAAASFDAFRDYEQRGDRFRELVEGLR
jgi:UDP-N-acetylmuramoylalanine--D-glutamate ligase